MSGPIEKGAVLAGKYRVERILGQGGMGVVVAARHVQLGELVAIKFLLPEMTMQAEVVERFAREARAAVRIKSEHVSRVIDVGVLDDGAPYMVMEYLDGADLGAVLLRDGKLPLDDAVDFVAQACEAIAEAHSLGIVHRDLKPSNLMLVLRNDGTPCIKVLDFGISKMAALGDTPELAMTKTSVALGSPLYMSPEQMVSARDVDGRTDIWALGAILYELVAGEPPFVAESFAALVLRVTQSPAAPLRQHRPEAPAALEAVVARCLSKDRTARFATVAELAQALLPFAPERARLPIDRALRILRGSGASDARVAATLAASMRGTGSSSQPGHERPQAIPTAVNWSHTAAGGAKRRRTATFVALAGVAAAGIVAAALALTRGAPSTASSASAPAATLPPTTTAPTATTQAPPATPTTDAPHDVAAVPPPSSASTSVVAPAPTAVVPTTTNVAAVPGRRVRPGHAGKSHAAPTTAPVAPGTPAATPQPTPAPVPAPQPTAPKGSAYDDM